MEVQFEDGIGFLIAKAAGTYSLDAMLRMFERVAAEAHARGMRRVLLDVIQVNGDVSDLDRYDMGRRAAEVFAHVERIGVIRNPQLRYTGFAFDVAQNRGLDARAFVERTDAERWLTGD